MQMATNAPTPAVVLERVILFNFKSFKGLVEIPLASPAVANSLHRGALCCVVGPNGSGKSSIADALMFCFGERDARAKTLATLINEEVASSKNDSMEGSEDVNIDAMTRKPPCTYVSVDLRVSEDSIVRVSRTIDKSGKSEYLMSTTPVVHTKDLYGSELASQQRVEKTITRTALVARLKRLGIDLEVVDSFICKQQSSTVAHLPGPQLLHLIEKLVGTLPIAARIEAQQTVADDATDGAVALEHEAGSVAGMRRALAPHRDAFEKYRAEQRQFCSDLSDFAVQEHRLYTHQRKRNEVKLSHASEELKAATASLIPAVDMRDAADAAVVESEGKCAAQRKVLMRAERKTAQEEEHKGKCAASLKALARKDAGSTKRLRDAQAASKLATSALEKAVVAHTSAEATFVEQGNGLVNEAKTKLEALLDSAINGGEDSRCRGDESLKNNNKGKGQSTKARQRAKLSSFLSVARAARGRSQAAAEAAIVHKTSAEASEALVEQCRSLSTATHLSLDKASTTRQNALVMSTGAQTKSQTVSETESTALRVAKAATATLRRCSHNVEQATLRVQDCCDDDDFDGDSNNVSTKAEGQSGISLLRRKVTPLIKELTFLPSNSEKASGISRGDSAEIFGWLDELAFANEHRFILPLNAVLASALNNTVVVGSRIDALTLIKRVRDSQQQQQQQQQQHRGRGCARIGPVSCDVLDELTANHPLGEATASSSPSNLVPLLDCIELSESRIRPVFAARFKNWFLCLDDDKRALAAAGKFKGAGGNMVVVNVVTLQGSIFLGDGEIRTTNTNRRRSGPGLRHRDAESEQVEANPEKIQAAKVALKAEAEATLASAESALMKAQNEQAVVLKAVTDAKAARKTAAKEERYALSAVMDSKEALVVAEDDAARSDRALKTATAKTKKEVAALFLSKIEAAAATSDAEKEWASLAAWFNSTRNTADEDISSVVSCNGSNAASSSSEKLLQAVEEAEEQVVVSERKKNELQASVRAAHASLKSAERTHKRCTIKASDLEAVHAKSAKDKAAATEALNATEKKAEAARLALTEATESLVAPRDDLEAAQSHALTCHATADKTQALVLLVEQSVVKNRKEAARLDTWAVTIDKRDAELKVQQENARDENEGEGVSDSESSDNDFIDEDEDDDDDNDMNVGNRKSGEEQLFKSAKCKQKDSKNFKRDPFETSPECDFNDMSTSHSQGKGTTRLRRNKIGTVLKDDTDDDEILTMGATEEIDVTRKDDEDSKEVKSEDKVQRQKETGMTDDGNGDSTSEDESEDDKPIVLRKKKNMDAIKAPSPSKHKCSSNTIQGRRRRQNGNDSGHNVCSPQRRDCGGRTGVNNDDAFSDEEITVEDDKLEGNEEAFLDKLAVLRASLRLRQKALQRLEDGVDVEALEKDVALASKEKDLALEMEMKRKQASDALHLKATLERQRFDRLFGSLEQVNGSFGTSYSELSLDGEADLRFSREPLTLYKEGVSIYAKPARSPWRSAASLSGGQQATVGLALLFALQFVYKSPFYLLDEVDASLDAQHAARAGALMQRRALSEGVQYIAISHRPQLYLHSDRMVGTYASCRVGQASKCVALDFAQISSTETSEEGGGGGGGGGGGVSH